MIPICVCVDASQRAVVQRCGQYSHTAGPGLNIIMWPWYTATNVSVKVATMPAHPLPFPQQTRVLPCREIAPPFFKTKI